MALKKFFQILSILIFSAIIYGYFKKNHSSEAKSGDSAEHSQQSADKKSGQTSPEAQEEQLVPQIDKSKDQRSLATKESSNEDSDLTSVLKKFQEESLQKWQIKKDLFSGRVKTLSFGKIKMAGSTIEDQGQSFIDSYGAEIFKVEAPSLSLKSKTLTAQSILRYEQNFRDKKIHGASLTLIFESGSLVRVQNDLISTPQLAADAERVLRNDELEQWLQSVSIAASQDIQKIGTSHITSIEDVYLTSPQGLIDGASINLERLTQGALKDKYQLIVDLTGPRVIRSIPLHKN